MSDNAAASATTTATTSTIKTETHAPTCSKPKPIPPPPAHAQTPPSPPPQQPFKWTWDAIDRDLFPDLFMPCLYRNEGDPLQICVRIIDTQVLARFLSIDTPEVKALGPLESQYCDEEQIRSLNEIN